MPARTLSPKEGRYRAVCQRKRWAPKGVDTRRCASKDARSQTEVDYEILHRLEREMSASEDVGPKVGGLKDLTSIGERNECQ